MAAPIVIVGAGLSGLAAALELEAAGESALMIESQDFIGGKLETTLVEDAYRLDRGFQVLLPAYPELHRFEALSTDLDLRMFNSGARLETDAGSLVMANPLEHPTHAFETAFGSFGTLKDKLLILKLQLQVRSQEPDALLSSASGSTRRFLENYGFSETIIEKFFRPFFAGIFLERELETEAGFFKYLFRMFGSSRVAVPAKGVQELPLWMANRLKRSEIRLSTRVRSVSGNSVEFEDGRKTEARAVITETAPPNDRSAFGAVTSFWFSAPEPPFEGAWLSLNSRSQRPVGSLNHLAILSNVSRDYALKGDALICASVVGHEVTSPANVRDQAEAIYGGSVKSWRLLREDRIFKAFPLYLQRHDSDTPSQQGALARGRAAARNVLKRL